MIFLLGACSQQPVPVSRTPVTSQVLGASSTASKSITPTPATRLYFDSDRDGGSYQVYAADADGTNPIPLTADPSLDSWWPRPSPDGRWVVFYRTPKGVHDRDYGKASLWRMRSDGSQQQQLLAPGANGWQQQGHAEWSPDGSHLVMFGGTKINPQIFITNADGTHLIPLTKRGGTNIDPSWSPDGITILFVGCPNSFCLPRDYEIYAIQADGSNLRRLTTNHLEDHDPYFSPDGSAIAWLVNTDPSGHGGIGTWNVFVMRADGSGQRNLTNDDAITSKPSWARDGSGGILFNRLPPGGSRWQLFSIAPDGGQPERLIPATGSNDEYPTQ